jgi:hypothetical protein
MHPGWQKLMLGGFADGDVHMSRDLIMEQFEAEYERWFSKLESASGVYQRDVLEQLDDLVLALIKHVRTGRCAGDERTH